MLMIFLNIRNISPNNTVLHPKRLESLAALLFEHNVSCSFHYVRHQTQSKLISVVTASSSPIYFNISMWNGIWFYEKFYGIVRWMFQLNGWHSCLYLRCCRIISQVQKLATLIENFPGILTSSKWIWDNTSSITTSVSLHILSDS